LFTASGWDNQIPDIMWILQRCQMVTIVNISIYVMWPLFLIHYLRLLINTIFSLSAYQKLEFITKLVRNKKKFIRWSEGKCADEPSNMIFFGKVPSLGEYDFSLEKVPSLGCRFCVRQLIFLYGQFSFFLVPYFSSLDTGIIFSFSLSFLGHFSLTGTLLFIGS